MKKYLYMAVAAIAALSSCTSDDAIVNENQNENQNENNKVEAPVFTATIENAGTRTQLVEGSSDDKMKVEWLSTDKVFMWSVDNAGTLKVMGRYDVAPNGSDASSATLTAASDIKYVNSETGDAATTLAIYPATITSLDSKSEQQGVINEYKGEGKGVAMQKLGDFYALSMPSEQKYNGDNISQIAPMAAYSQSGGTLTFKNLTSLLAITVPASEFASVRNIVVTTDKQMWGEFKLDTENMKAVPNDDLIDEMEELKSVTLNCKDANGNNTAIPTDGSKTFYVSIPANTYSNIQIVVTDGKATKTMKTKAESITVDRNTIYEIVFDTRIRSFTATGCVPWWNTDKISVNGVTYKLYSYVPNTYDCTAIFVPEVEGQVATADASGKYCAIYPASAATDDGKIYIPSSVNSLSPNIANDFRYAESTTNELSFQKLITCFHLTVLSDYDYMVIKVKTDRNIKLSGTFDLKNWDITPSDNDEKYIVFQGPFDAEGGRMDIDIPLPVPRTDSENYGMSMSMTVENGTKTDNSSSYRIYHPESETVDPYYEGTWTFYKK